jgi:hypothetical protein
LGSLPATADSENGTDRRQGAKSGTETPEKVPKDVRKAFTKRRKRNCRQPADPPDKKRSPGSVVKAEHGAKQNSKSLSRKHNTKRPQKAQEPDRNLAVYDGQIRVGNITVTGGKFFAALPDGARVGRFKTLGEASAALQSARDNRISHDGGGR